jgi:FAD-NAD(P)-binding
VVSVPSGTATRIAVVGVGPRGLSVLERVISRTRGPGAPVELVLVEPGELGIGIHRPEQPDYLLLNTIAAQLTIFSDPAMTPDGPVTPGPSLFEWCRDRGVPVRFDEFLPRRLLGEYLRWAVGELLGRASDRLSITHVPAVAVDVRPDGRGAGERSAGAVVTLADGRELTVDLAVVTTGHGLADEHAGEHGEHAGEHGEHGPRAEGGEPVTVEEQGLIDVPYPLPERVGSIPAGATVALLGSGLTAMDVIAALTLGRGGRFEGDGYRPSGREPVIVLAGRSGRVPCGRPATTPVRRPAPARYLTREAVDELRRRRPDGRLDFRRDLEPLIRAEARHRMAGAGADEIAAVERALRPGDDPDWGDYPAYRDATVAQAARDLAEAERGLGSSLVKEGLEVLRDHREALRAAIDAPGLTEESRRYFWTEYVPLVNRVVIGPQKERIRELLILLAQGIVRLGPGPRAALTRPTGAGHGWELSSTRLAQPHRIAVDTVVRANLTWPSVDPRSDPVAVSLREWGARDPGGPALALDRDGRVRPAVTDGRTADPDAGSPVVVLGPPAEGASYYNHYVPSPGVWSRALTDLDRALRPALERAARTDRGGPGTDEIRIDQADSSVLVLADIPETKW